MRRQRPILLISFLALLGLLAASAAAAGANEGPPGGLRVEQPAGELDRQVEALRNSASPLIERQDAYLLLRDVRSLLDAADMGRLLEMLKAEMARNREKDAPPSGGPIVFRFPNQEAIKLQRLQERVKAAAFSHACRDFALQVENAYRGGGARLVQETCLALDAAPDIESTARILQALPDRLSEARRIGDRIQAWSDKNPDALRRIAADNRQLIVKARAGRDPAALQALSLAVELDRVLEDQDTLKTDIDALAAAARQFLEEDKARWWLCQVGDFHLNYWRHALATQIYRPAYDPARLVDGKLPASVLQAGLKIVQCEWEQGRLTGAKYEDRREVWTLLNEMRDHLIWDERLEKAYSYFIGGPEGGLDVSGWKSPESLDLLPVYYRFLMKNAATEHLRHHSGVRLEMMLEWGGRPQEAAAVYEELAKIVTSEELKRIYGEKAAKLRGQGPEIEWRGPP